LLRRDHGVVPDYFQLSGLQRLLGACDECIIDKGHSRRVFESVLVNAINDESNRWFDHWSPWEQDFDDDSRTLASLEQRSRYCFMYWRYSAKRPRSGSTVSATLTSCSIALAMSLYFPAPTPARMAVPRQTASSPRIRCREQPLIAARSSRPNCDRQPPPVT